MAQDLLAELNRRGIKLRLTDGRLDVLAPAGSLTTELREELKLRRDQLMELLSDASAGLPEITPLPGQRHEPFPLTDIQHAYWVGRSPAVELGGVCTHYYFELDGDGLQPRRLEHSLRQVIERHDMLRAIVQPDGQQRILPGVPGYEIAVGDLRGLSPAAKQAELSKVRAQMGRRVPPPDTWPLLEVHASLLDDRRIRLHISVNMLIVDAFSLSLMFADWSRFYAEPGWSPPPLAISYRDYVLASEKLREGSRYRKAEEYWRQRLGSLPPAPALPLARPPAQLTATEFTSRAARLNPGRWAFIKRLARQHGITPSTVLMTAFADVLRLWSGQPGFTINLTLFERPPLHPVVGELIGDFTSLTMLAVTAGQDRSFADRAARLQQQLMRDLEHSAYSGVRVLRERARRLASGPEASMPVVFTSAIGASGNASPKTGRDFFGRFRYSTSQTPQVWLDHQVSEDRGELLLNWDAVGALFPDGLLDDMFACYRGLLGALSTDELSWDEAGPLARPPRWQLAERDRANATAAGIPAATLCGLAEAAARRYPDATAVIAADGQLTHAEVGRHARRLARRLTALGAGRGTLVGVVMEKGWEQVPAVLGVCQSGAAYLPVNPQWPQERRRQVLEQGGVAIVVTTPRLRELTWPAGIRVITLADAEVRRASGGPLTSGPGPDDLAYVIFTSGSTGQPKGVMIDHRGAANTIQDINSRFRVGPGDRVLGLSSLTFDLSVYDIFGMLAAGGAVVLPPAEAVHDTACWAGLMSRHGVTIWDSVPALMQAWTESGGPPPDAPAAKLRLVMLSGDTIPVSLPGEVRAVHPGAEVISLGGATEASIWSVWYPIGEVPAQWARIPYGKPLANQTLHVYDGQLRPVPVWTTGELYIGGAGLALGYWADPGKTAERFRIHPVTGERLYHTGDLARYQPGGDIEFLGRADSQVKLNGYRIELGEIGAALRGCQDVADAIADVKTSPSTGRRHLVGYVVPATGGSAAAVAADPGLGEAAWAAMLAAGAAEARQAAAGLAGELAVFEQWWRLWEELCPQVMARTLASLGMFTEPGQTGTASQIVRRCGVKPHYAGLIAQWLSVLAAEGMLAPAGQAGEYRSDRGLDAGQLGDGIASRLAGLGHLLDQPAVADVHRAFAGYLRACADNHTGLLRGEVSPLALLLADETGQVTGALYADNPVSHLLNRVAARLVHAVTGDCAPGRPARVLEVGAGTGATSAQILPGLPPGLTRYRFTDISTFFTQRAKRDFAGYPFVDYGQYDIDCEPVSQGIAPGSADVVVAANVLHDARDLAATLGYLRLALAPGGVLIAIEGTANSRIQMISVGFIEGFGNHEGGRELPLLPVAQWREQLAAAGFTRFASVPDGEPVAQAMIQHVLIAQAPGGQPAFDPGLLRQTLDGLLPGYMVPQHYMIIDRVPLSPNGKIDRSALPAPWDGAAPRPVTEPRDAIERTLLGIWHGVLDRDDFGVEDNFFELGGDSLHAVRIFGLLRDELGAWANADEGMQELFEAPTVAALAAALRQSQTPQDAQRPMP